MYSYGLTGVGLCLPSTLGIVGVKQLSDLAITLSVQPHLAMRGWKNGNWGNSPPVNEHSYTKIHLINDLPMQHGDFSELC